MDEGADPWTQERLFWQQVLAQNVWRPTINTPPQSAPEPSAIVKWSGVLLALMAVAVIVQILAMRSELLVMIEHLEGMYMDFRVMAQNLDGMTGQVGVIQTRVAGLPYIAKDVTEMSAEVWSMRTAIGEMDDSVRTMSTDVAVLRDTTGEMGFHFRDVNSRLII